MRLRKPAWLKATAVAFLAPALLIGLATAALAATPAPAGGTAVAGDKAKGEALYNSSGCTACHGAALGGGIGPPLRPIKNLGDTKDPLDPAYLTTTIANGKNGVGGYGQMPARGGAKLSDKDVQDIIAYLIDQNLLKGPVPLAAGALAMSTVTWVTIGILGMLVLTYFLSRYNMRWIARKAGHRSSKY